MNRGTRFLFVTGGTIAVGMGVIGVLVPLLPTTPFLLLAAFLYARSSERFHKWLLGNRWIGDYLRRYYERRCMTRRHKAFTLVLLWIGIGLSAGFVVPQWWARLLLAVVAAGVTVHVLCLGTD